MHIQEADTTSEGQIGSPVPDMMPNQFMIIMKITPIYDWNTDIVGRVKRYEVKTTLPFWSQVEIE